MVKLRLRKANFAKERMVVLGLEVRFVCLQRLLLTTMLYVVLKFFQAEKVRELLLTAIS